MMNHIGEDMVRNLFAQKNKDKAEFQIVEIIPSRFIIQPENYWKM
tara:strand:- start:396 stop:530 length:135 start_codon:yes stop_codon:yes gene_type:complete